MLASESAVAPRRREWSIVRVGLTAFAGVVLFVGCSAERAWTPYTEPPKLAIQRQGESVDFTAQTKEQSEARSAGCIECHQNSHDPHDRPGQHKNKYWMSCVDCHGGDGVARTIEDAHPKPRDPARFATAANPQISYMGWMQESWDWVRFVNPGDLRVANVTCGGCHADMVLKVSKSIMTTGAHLWSVAGYANGIVSVKQGIFGESYSPEGIPQKVNTVPPPTSDELARGVLPSIVPLPNFEISQPGNVFRTFEQGSRLGGPALGFNGASLPLVGIPDKLEDAGRPNNRLSDRGYGTLTRVDLGVLNLHKTRLNDPHLSLLGTNDNPGDYRSSGCTACHVVYANDRTKAHSGPYAAAGSTGRTQTSDPTISKSEKGHPIRHEFTSAIPSSQCMTCHMHQPNSFVNSYYGYTMWSYETDGELMWPKVREEVSHEDRVARLNKNPEEAAVWGKWHDQDFLRDVSTLNPQLKHTQFADYHGHGWIFRAAFKMDRKGNLLDAADQVVDYDDPQKFAGVIEIEGVNTGPAAQAAQRRAVHLQDIHAQMGMHCVDCHFQQDAHGDGKLYSSYQDAVEVRCVDCHGTVWDGPTLKSSGPASASSGSEGRELQGSTPFGTDRFELRGEALIQRSMVTEGKEWTVKIVKNSVNPLSPSYNPRAAYAKTMRKDGRTWEGLPSSPGELAHGCDNAKESKLECYTCHTSWVTACFGCHLPQRANWRAPSHHFDDETNLRQYASYNPQAVRDAEFMMGVAGDSKGNRIAPVRSSSALLLSSEDAQRQKTYAQIAPIATNGMSSQLFNTHFPHTVRTRETRKCDDCHVSAADDNNAWLAQAYLLGTGYVNFIGYNVFAGAGEHGFYAIRATEWDEPQAVIGSNLHRLAYPQDHEAFVEKGRKLVDHSEHGSPDCRSLQLCGEYLYCATGAGGFRVYDVANVNNKGFSEKIVTSPVSPLGQDTHVPTSFATAVALATTNRVSMARLVRPENGEKTISYRGVEQNLHESYRFAYVTDLYDGLVIVDVDCLSDGDPRNNFIEKVAQFNPDGLLNGAVNLTVAGTTVYVCCDRGIVAVDIDDPRAPKIIGQVGAPAVNRPTSISVQLRYAFVTDNDGLKVLDVTLPAQMRAVEGAVVPIADARDVYVARTYAYVSAGTRGLVIVDVERPRAPKIDQEFNAGGVIDDLCQVKVGMTNDSLFAYLADGKNGMRVLQLVSPGDGQPRSAYGFSPRPKPDLIATFPAAHGRISALSRGLDRDRAVDESGHQMAAFGRVGSRPFNLEEMRRLYLRGGALYTVTNEPRK
jgi:hypothetical protein